MRFIYKASLTILLVVVTSFSLLAQKSFFTATSEAAIKTGDAKRVIVPSKYHATVLNTDALKAFLWSLPSESNFRYDRSNAPVLELPMPDGHNARFHVWESSIQEPGLQAKFPDIKTFSGQGIDDPYATIRFDYNPYFGFHAQVLSANGNIYIDPYARGNINYYISYYTKDYERDAPFFCNTQEDPVQTAAKTLNTNSLCRGTQLYTYRLAIACTGEYAQAVGGTTPSLLHAAIVTTVNRVDGVYESELSIRLILVANNDLVEYTDPTTDPFAGNNSAGTLIGESQNVITTMIGTSNFDIGHTFSTGGGGLAGLGVVCNASNKARGITGSPSPVGDDYDIDYVAHEMGHQFGGSHTFNSVTSNCGGGNRSASQAYEVGSGTTIQAYAGICGSDNIQPHSDPYFHAISFDQISNYVEAGGASCHGTIATGNTLPVITAMNNGNANIPLSTPFTLSGTATDANGDALTYSWEEWDLNPTGGAWNNGSTSTLSPLFKSRTPKTTGSRTFPDIAVILAGYPSNPAAAMNGLKGEILPTVARTMNFRLTVRDNRAGGGGVTSGGSGCQPSFGSAFQVNAIAGTGPFVVNAPNGGESYPGGSTQTITWNVAGTDAAPISVSNVKISLSTDGGLTYPTVLAASTPNDGSEVLTIPSSTTTTARVKIEAVGNIFFDISNNNFTITAAATGYDFDNPAAASVPCSAGSAAITLGTTVTGGYSTPINLSATGNPAGTTVSFGTNPLTPGSSTTVTLNNTNTLAAGSYNVTITGVSGTITKTRVLTFTVQSGTPVITSQPVSQTLCLGSNANFGTAATGAVSYQWQLSTDGGANYSNIAGANSAGFTVNSITTAMNNNRYRVVINGACAPAATSSAATLTVISPVAVTTNASSTTICETGNVSFTAAGTSSVPVIYQWQVSTDNGANFSNINNGGIYGGATTPTLSVTGVTASMNNYRYRVLMSNATCTAPIASNSTTPAVLTVNARPTVTLSAAPITSLQPGMTTTLTANINPSAAGFNISWFRNGTLIPGVSGTTYTTGVTGIGDYQVSIVNAATGCNNQSQVLAITPLASARLFIFPVPNNGKFTIAYYNSTGTVVRNVDIFDSHGALVYQRSYSVSQAYQLLDVNMISAADGIYLVLLKDASGKKIATGKVMIGKH